MFGINDPGILLAYLLGIGCLVFSIWYGITRWDSEDKDSNNPENPQP